MRGRKPTPPALKLITGNPGKRPIEADPHAIEIAVPGAPEHLNAIARAEWERVTAELLKAGLVTRLDRPALAAYCDAWAEYVHAKLMMDRPAEEGGGYMVKTPNGYEVQSPWLAVANKAFEKMLKVGVEFAMTASARNRVHGRQPGLFDDDPMEAILRAGARLA